MLARHCEDLRVFEIIGRSPSSVRQDIVRECPNLTWNQVFGVAIRFRREGVITTNPKEHSQHVSHLSDPHHTMPSARQCVNKLM